jgi:polysaccharide deacetylase 2 family uncharacterized protein YibQ
MHRKIRAALPWIALAAAAASAYFLFSVRTPPRPAGKPAAAVETVLPRRGHEIMVARPSKKKPKIALVIDDIGYHLQWEKELEKLGDRVTYAVLPQLPYSRHFSRLGRDLGADVILHQPMEPINGMDTGPGIIRRSMNAAEIAQTLDRNLATVPEAYGINNHMGSLGTGDLALMRSLLAEIKKRKLFFLDSYTNTSSVAAKAGYEHGMKIRHRDVFLDNVNETEAIRREVQNVKAAARQRGYAIAIGHYRKYTLLVLAEEIPRLEKEGYEIVPLRSLAA